MHTRTSLSSGCLKTGQRLTALIKLGERPSIMQWGLGASPSSCISLSGEFVFCMLPGWSSSPWREQYQTRHSVAVASLPLARTLVRSRRPFSIPLLPLRLDPLGPVPALVVFAASSSSSGPKIMRSLRSLRRFGVQNCCVDEIRIWFSEIGTRVV